MFNMAMASYLESEYNEILRISEDSAKLDDTWQEWKVKSGKRIRQLEQMGMKVERVTVHPQELEEYCKEKDLPIIGSSRAQLATEKLAKQAK